MHARRRRLNKGRRSGKIAKFNEGTFSEVTSSTTYTTKMSIHDLVVRDVIPTTEDKRGTTVQRKPPLVDGNGVESKGKFEWKWKVGSSVKVNPIRVGC
ncbi:hypothetical protein GALMADRAFT_234676 [Galerina marginata CBS 339.88]|uniref:Uncharacterized protein n=1 Tax=Galerina marginata (strain CBS 339.88) TaxID=685588 RepID=A0A067TTL1_GALM3|nr:hypothetical protein GALMADRAFT_234676 [Galerina marginata CBS 339.88]